MRTTKEQRIEGVMIGLDQKGITDIGLRRLIRTKKCF